MITDLRSALAHVLEPDELVDQLLHGLVGECTTVMLEVVVDGLCELLARRWLAAQRVQLLDDGRELVAVEGAYQARGVISRGSRDIAASFTVSWRGN